MATVEILGEPQETIPDLVTLAAPTGEFEPQSGKPQDLLQEAAEAVGRANVSYEHLWKAVYEANGRWVIMRCNSARRALLLASAALQHRTQPHDVSRRGRVVSVRLRPEVVRQSA